MNNIDHSHAMTDAQQNPEKARLVQHALAQLSQQQRSCLLLQEDAGFSKEEIADILELDPSTVERILQSAYHQFWQHYTRLEQAHSQQEVQELAHKQHAESEIPASYLDDLHLKPSDSFTDQFHEEHSIPLHEITIPHFPPDLPEQMLLLWEAESKVDYLQDRTTPPVDEVSSISEGGADLAHGVSSKDQECISAIEEELQFCKKKIIEWAERGFGFEEEETSYDDSTLCTQRGFLLKHCMTSDLDVDEILQKVRIRLWIEPFAGGTPRDTHTLVCQELQKEFSTLQIWHFTGHASLGKSCHHSEGLSTWTYGNASQKDSCSLTSSPPLGTWGPPDPLLAFEQEGEVMDRLDQLVYALLSLPPVQRTAIVCSLRERLEDFAPFAAALKKSGMDISGITWPEDQTAKQRLQTAYQPAQLQLARLMKINLNKYEPQRRQYIGFYVLAKEIASNPFDSVYLARTLSQKYHDVTVKVFMADLSSETERRGFRETVQCLKKLKHPHILPVLDGDIEGKTPYLVTEYAQQGSLRQRLLRHARQPFPFSEALSLILPIGQAVHNAHQQNIIHQNIKPENILFNDKGEAMLADFWIATSLYKGEDRPEIQHAITHQTLSYMAPEQLQGRASKSSDQYALACVTYELLTGQRPFVADDSSTMVSRLIHQQPLSPKLLNPQLPSFVEHVLLTALNKQEKKRYANIQSFLTALQAPSPCEFPLWVTLNVCTTCSQNSSKVLEQWMATGALYYQTQRFEEAQKIYELVLSLNPSYAPAYNGQGKVLLALHQYPQALRAYEKALELDATIAEAHQRKGDILSWLGRSADALVAYDKALQLDPFLADAYGGIGDIHYKLTHYEKALAAYEQAILLCPTQRAFHTKKSAVLERLGKYAEALQARRKAKSLE